MSSSSSARQATPQATTFTYAEAGAAGEPASSSAHAAPLPNTEEAGKRERAEGFEQGRANAQQEMRAEIESSLARQREAVHRALQQFSAERKTYYRRVEGEVVQLALAIARKILHREAQIDPHILTSIVRLTLEKLDTGTAVHLHVSPREATDWRHFFATQPEGRDAPEVHEDGGLNPGECRIETSLGSTEIGIASQLKEIETGLLDLLAERPWSSTESDGRVGSPVSPAPAPTTAAPAPLAAAARAGQSS